MLTIKLPYICQDDSFKEYLFTLRKQQSIVIRSAYNRFNEDIKQKEVRYLVSKLNNISDLDSWMVNNF